MAQIISVGKSVTKFSAIHSELISLSENFEAYNYVKISRFLSDDALNNVHSLMSAEEFKPHQHRQIGDQNMELKLHSKKTVGLLTMLMNCHKVYKFIQAVTKCAPIGCFKGRVYRCIPGQNHSDQWHSDWIDHRMVAVSINLSLCPYKGGVLQIRNSNNEKILAEVENTTPGDAIIFKLSADLEHRITNVEGTEPKTAFAGWFCSQPSFKNLITQTQ